MKLIKCRLYFSIHFVFTFDKGFQDSVFLDEFNIISFLDDKVTELEASEKPESVNTLQCNIFCASCCSRISDMKEINFLILEIP